MIFSIKKFTSKEIKKRYILFAVGVIISAIAGMGSLARLFIYGKFVDAFFTTYFTIFAIGLFLSMQQMEILLEIRSRK